MSWNALVVPGCPKHLSWSILRPNPYKLLGLLTVRTRAVLFQNIDDCSVPSLSITIARYDARLFNCSGARHSAAWQRPARPALAQQQLIFLLFITMMGFVHVQKPYLVISKARNCSDCRKTWTLTCVDFIWTYRIWAINERHCAQIRGSLYGKVFVLHTYIRSIEPFDPNDEVWTKGAVSVLMILTSWDVRGSIR